MNEEQKAWREGFARAAKEDRLRDAKEMLAAEREVYSYLVAEHKDGAAKKVLDNIQRMTQRVMKYEQELND